VYHSIARMIARLNPSTSIFGWLTPSRSAMLFGGASFAWAAAIPTAAVAAAQQAPGAFTYGFAFIVYAAGSLVCHQLPERSFHLLTRQFPVCARCTGIYAGAAIGSLAALAPFGMPTRGLTARTERAVAFCACVPTAATLVFEWATGVTPSNVVRAMAGIALGAPIAWLVARFLTSAARTPATRA
jgi:uncharacterized membrane protein